MKNYLKSVGLWHCYISAYNPLNNPIGCNLSMSSPNLRLTDQHSDLSRDE